MNPHPLLLSISLPRVVLRGLMSLLAGVTCTIAQAQATPGQLLQDIRALQPPVRELPVPSAETGLQLSPDDSLPTGAVQFVIRRFVFEGHAKLSSEALQQALSAWLDKPITYGDLRQGIEAITALYRAQGLLARAVLPPQDITEGQVTVRIIESRLGGLAIDNRSLRIGQADIQAWFDSQTPTGQVIDLVALDHALLSLDDAPAISAKGYLQPGQEAGQTVLALQIEDKPRANGQALLDNFGDPNTGKQRLSAQLNLNGLTGWADQLSLYGLRTQGSTYARLGWTTTTAAATRGQRLGVYASTMDYSIQSNAFQAAGITGASQVLGLEATDPVIRSRQTNVVVSFNWAHSRFKSWNDGVLNTDRTQSSHVAQWGVSGNRLDDGQGGISTASLMASMGDIERGPGTDTYAVGGLFSKLRYGLTRTHTLTPGWTLFASLTGQIASHNMDSSEQLYLGGPLNVRAYASGQGAASQGQLYTLELRKQLPQQTQLVIFYDEGRAQSWKRPPVSHNVDNRYHLRGTGLSLSWLGPYGLQVKATWAQRLGQPSTSVSNSLAQNGGLDRQRFWLNASVPF
jgi:hemolysin activation/secretion protein